MYPSGRTCTSTPPSIWTVINGKASRSADVNVMQKWLSLQVLYGWGGGEGEGGQSAHRYVESEHAAGMHPDDGHEDDGDEDIDDDIPAYAHLPEI